MLELKFDWRDILQAPRLVLSLQKMWIQLVGMSVGFVVYLILSYLSLVAAGYEWTTAWSQFGLLPCLFAIGDVFPWYSWLIAALGSLFLFVTWVVTNTAVARVVYMTSKGIAFYTWRESFAFAFRKFWSLVLTPLALIVLIGLLVLGTLVVGLLGKIPLIGEIGVSLFTIPSMLGALVIFFLSLVTIVATILLPSILATTDDDAFEAIFQSMSIAWNQPWRFLFYLALTAVLSVLALAGLAFFIKQAILIMNAMLSLFMGADYINLANNGQALLQGWVLQAQAMLDALYHGYASLFYFSKQFIAIPAADLPASVVIASHIYALSLLFVGGWILSYGLSTFTAGTTVSFIILNYKKDKSDLLERLDAEEEIQDVSFAEEAADEKPDAESSPDE